MMRSRVTFIAAIFVVSRFAVSSAESLELSRERIVEEIDGEEYLLPQPHLDAVERWERNERLKIIDGKEAKLGAFPWQVSLSYVWDENPVGAHFCGGTLLARDKVLTAAHCVLVPKAAQIRVSAGLVKLGEAEGSREVSKILLHKNFRHPRIGDDIAILELSTPFDLSENIKSIKLAANDDWMVPPDSSTGLGATQLTVLGWGVTSTPGGIKSPVLMYLNDIPYASNETCKRSLARGRYVTSEMLCAGYVEGGRDTCQGDSGGPLVTLREGISQQVGIVSWGEGCAVPRKFGVYARIAAYFSWVEDCLNPSKECLAKEQEQ